MSTAGDMSPEAARLMERYKQQAKALADHGEIARMDVHATAGTGTVVGVAQTFASQAAHYRRNAELMAAIADTAEEIAAALRR